MSPREGIYYVGLMGGIIAGVGIAQSMGWHHLIGLGIGVVLGIGLGAVFQSAYDGNRAARSSGLRSSSMGQGVPSGGNTITCRACHWTGDPGVSVFCPECGERLR
jgi:hypothetical protein